VTGRSLHLADAQATEAAGAALAQVLAARSGAVVYLYGDLGAGKTTLARGLLHALGVDGAVRSPTYTLIEPYSVDGRSIVHMDLYRLADPEECWGLGLDAWPPDRSLWLVEWPERAAGLLPAPTLEVRLAVQGGGRGLELAGAPGTLAAVVEKLKIQP
jgi:tRNA threonylcarbamoyladenosine biosynthesis protein TsaE